MIIFDLLCPLLIWPLGRYILRYGFTQTRYTWTALLSWIVGSAVFFMISDKIGFPMILCLGFISGIILNHVIYEMIGQFSSPRQIEDRHTHIKEADQRLREDVIATTHMQTEWISVKVYASSTQQTEYVRDRELLANKGVRFTTIQSGITNLLVHPDDTESADEILGIHRHDAQNN